MGDLPKLLTRAFAIGYLLPAVVLVLALAGIFHAFGRMDALLKLLLPPDATLAVVSLVTISFISILLLALNFTLIRVLEGYGKFNPARLWAFYRRKQFRELLVRKAETRKQWDDLAAKKKPVDPAITSAYADAIFQLARNFPDQEGLVLPTKFGNILRAFEVYPRVVYGIESTIGWTRLHGAISKEYRELINDEKSKVDFWVNAWFIGCFSLLVYFILAAIDRSLPMPWIPVIAFLVAFCSSAAIADPAYNWGVLVMSSFDLYREDLAAKLGLKLPRTIEKEREMWQTASQVWVYRWENAAKKLDAFRANAAAKEKQKK